MPYTVPPGDQLLQRTAAPTPTADLGNVYPFLQGAQRLVDAWDRLQAGGAPMSEILAMIAEPGAFNPAAHFVQQQIDTMGMSIEESIAHLRTVLAQPGAGGPTPGLDTRARVPSPEELRGRQLASRPMALGGAARSYPTPPPSGAWAGYPQPSQRPTAPGGLLGRVQARPASRPVAPGTATPAPPLLSRLTAGVRPGPAAPYSAPTARSGRLRRLMGGF